MPISLNQSRLRILNPFCLAACLILAGSVSSQEPVTTPARQKIALRPGTQKHLISDPVILKADFPERNKSESQAIPQGQKYQKLILTGLGMASLNSINSYIPYGVGASMAYHLCKWPCQIKAGKISMDWVAQAGYIRFQNSPYAMDSFNFMGGASLRFSGYLNFNNVAKSIAFGVTTTAGVAQETIFTPASGGSGASFIASSGVFAAYDAEIIVPYFGAFYYYSHSAVIPLSGINIQLGISWSF